MTDPLSFTFDVGCSPEHAFDVWTSRIDPWWPPSTASPWCSSSGASRAPDGASTTVTTAWEPPSRLAYTWHIGRSAREATDVEIRFLASDEGSTRVEINQSGWHRFGEEAGPWRDRNRVSWDSLLPRYRSAIERND